MKRADILSEGNLEGARSKGDCYVLSLLSLFCRSDAVVSGACAVQKSSRKVPASWNSAQRRRLGSLGLHGTALADPIEDLYPSDETRAARGARFERLDIGLTAGVSCRRAAHWHRNPRSPSCTAASVGAVFHSDRNGGRKIFVREDRECRPSTAALTRAFPQSMSSASL